MVNILASNGADINSKDNENKTPLHYAAQLYNKKMIYELLKFDADVEAKDINGNTPLLYLERLNHDTKQSKGSFFSNSFF